MVETVLGAAAGARLVYRLFVPTFLLRDAETGDDAGSFRVSNPRWGLGDVFVTGDGRRLRIVDMLEVVPTGVNGVWLVEPVEPKRVA